VSTAASSISESGCKCAHFKVCVYASVCLYVHVRMTEGRNGKKFKPVCTSSLWIMPQRHPHLTHTHTLRRTQCTHTHTHAHTCILKLRLVRLRTMVQMRLPVMNIACLHAPCSNTRHMSWTCSAEAAREERSALNEGMCTRRVMCVCSIVCVCMIVGVCICKAHMQLCL